MKHSYTGRTYLFAVPFFFFINVSHEQMAYLKQTLQAVEELHIPLETCNVSQFAFAAFSGVAAGHKVNSSWGRVRVKRNKQSHRRLKPTSVSYFHVINPVYHSMGAYIVPFFPLNDQLDVSKLQFCQSTPCPGNNSRHKQRLAALLTTLALTYWEVYPSKKAQPQCLQEALLSCLSCRADCRRICSLPGSHTCF